MLIEPHPHFHLKGLAEADAGNNCGYQSIPVYLGFENLIKNNSGNALLCLDNL
jgi:hypothetical protein